MSEVLMFKNWFYVKENILYYIIYIKFKNKQNQSMVLRISQDQGFSRQELRGGQRYFFCHHNIQMIFHLPEPHIKRATVMSQHMPTGTVRSLQMFLKHSLSFSVFGEERKRAIYHRNWPESRGPWIMYRPYFERAKRHYAKVALIRQES